MFAIQGINLEKTIKKEFNASAVGMQNKILWSHISACKLASQITHILHNAFIYSLLNNDIPFRVYT